MAGPDPGPGHAAFSALARTTGQSIPRSTAGIRGMASPWRCRPRAAGCEERSCGGGGRETMERFAVLHCGGRNDAWTGSTPGRRSRRSRRPGSFAAAARRLGRSPAAVTRAVAALEEQLGHACSTAPRAPSRSRPQGRARWRRRVARWLHSGAQGPGTREVRGRLGVTAPIVFGRLHLLPVVDAFLHDHPATTVQLLLLDRVVSLVDEGFDVAIRLGRLPDSSLRAVRGGRGAARRVCQPGLLTVERETAHAAGPRATPVRRLQRRDAGSRSLDVEHDGRSFVVPAPSRLVVNTAEAAIDAALAGLGPTCVLSYQVDAHVRAGRLERILGAFEPGPMPVQVVTPAGRFVTPLVRAFVERAVEALRARLGSSSV